MAVPASAKPPFEERDFPLTKVASHAFSDDKRMFTWHPTYGKPMGMTTGDKLVQAMFVRFTQETPLDIFPAPYYIIVLRGNLKTHLTSGQSRAFGVGTMLHVAEPSGKFIPSGAMGLVLLTKKLPTSVVMQPAPQGSQENYNFVTLKVIEKGDSAIEFGRSIPLNRTWGPGLITSATVEVIAMSLCDAYPTLTAPLHPAYSKYLNWTTWLGPGRAEFGTSNGQTADVGAGDIVLFDDAEGEGHAYKVANNTQVKQVFITLNQEVTRWGHGPSGFEAGLEGRAWNEEKKPAPSKI